MAADKYSEAEGVIEQVVNIFSEKKDLTNAKEIGKDIHDLRKKVNHKHQQMIKAIKNLAQQADRQQQAHLEKKELSTEEETQRMDKEKFRLSNNVNRLRQVSNLATFCPKKLVTLPSS